MSVTDNLNPAFHNEVASKIVGPSQDFVACDNARELILQRQAVKHQKPITQPAICLFQQAYSHDSVRGQDRGKRQTNRFFLSGPN